MAMEHGELMEIFNNPNRIGILTTSDGKGNVNSGLFGSPRMVDRDTVVMACGDNRSLANMRRNPRAVYLFFEPKTNLADRDWKGARVYLKAEKFEKEGLLLDRFIEEIRARIGVQAASILTTVVTFRIEDIRPLIDRPLVKDPL
jgi:hypothetical protein